MQVRTPQEENLVADQESGPDLQWLIHSLLLDNRSCPGYSKLSLQPSLLLEPHATEKKLRKCASSAEPVKDGRQLVYTLTSPALNAILCKFPALPQLPGSLLGSYPSNP